jgi:hypothetical protein
LKNSKRPAAILDTNTPPKERKKKKKENPLDKRLAPVRELIESQPQAIQLTISNFAVAMLLATQSLRAKRAGILSKRMNESSFPKSIALKMRLEYPTEMKDDPESIANSHDWSDYIQEVRLVLKNKILHQGDRNCVWMQSRRITDFTSQLVALSEGYATYHRELALARGAPLTNLSYGAAGVYCFGSKLQADDPLWSYLEQDRDAFLRGIKENYLTNPDGSTTLSESQLKHLSGLPPTPAAAAFHSPQRTQNLNGNNIHDRRPQSDNDNAEEETDLQTEEATEDITIQPPPTNVPPVRNPYLRDVATRTSTAPVLPPPPQNLAEPRLPPPPPTVPPALAQSPATSEQPNDGELTDQQFIALTEHGDTIVYKVRDIMSVLVTPLFIELATTTALDQRAQRAEAQLEASLKKKATLDMSKAIEATLAAEPTVAHANMEGLIGHVVNKKLHEQKKQEEKTFLKQAIKEARKKSLGGGGTAKKRHNPSPRKPSSGGGQRRNSRTVTFDANTTPPPKQPRKETSYTPNADYATHNRQRQNPYWQGPTPTRHQHSQSGRGSFRGRGRGRGRGRDASNRGRASGRSRF